METHLTIKELAPYLPYDLNILGIHSEQLGTDSSVLTKVENMHLLSGISNGFAVFDNSTHGNPIEQIKPILRPLLDLTKEILYQGHSIRAIDYISTSKANSQRIMRRVVNQQNLDCLEYWQFERLIQLHFDVFELIEKGLAIDINALTITDEH